MEQTITIKVKLLLDDASDAAKFHQTMEQYRQGCNFVSAYLFNHDFVMSQAKLNATLYQPLRHQFGLKSQMAQSAIRTTVARYRTVKTQLSQKPYRYDSGEIDHFGNHVWKTIPRDLSWLWRPINFARPQVDLQRNRDWSKRSDGRLSINTLAGRALVTPVCHGFDQYFDGSWKLGLAKLLFSHNNWMLHISATKELPDYQTDQTQHVVGIDRGLRFLATTYDEHGQTKFHSGKQIMRKRRKFKRLRAQLQAKGTKSAHRRLKKIGQRENRWMTDVNHQLSKTLVNQFGPNTLFVVEDLTGVRFATERVRKTKRYEQVSWAFFQLEQFLTYKANLNGSHVIKVGAAYTSQRCPKCGRICKANRDHDDHLYRCDRCGYQTNDDRLGAMNIQLLGTHYVSGTKHPSLKKLTTSE